MIDELRRENNELNRVIQQQIRERGLEKDSLKRQYHTNARLLALAYKRGHERFDSDDNE